MTTRESGDRSDPNQLGYSGFEGRAGWLLEIVHSAGVQGRPQIIPDRNVIVAMSGKHITLVLGGVGSGKSRYAQALASRANNNVVFLATAQACDEEMRAKIARHVRERPPSWKTVEVPFELHRAILEYGASSFLIVDCLTTFTTNLLVLRQASYETILACIEEISRALEQSPASAVLVSNEVGSGIVPEFPSGREFREILGQVNQRMARISDNVILMVAGYPLAVKGTAEVSS